MSSKTDMKDCREISSLLVSKGAKFAILSTERAAKHFGTVSSNFDNKILSTGAKVPTPKFYRWFLSETWDLAVALLEARRAMFPGLLSNGHTRSPDAIITHKVLVGNQEILAREYGIFKIEQLPDNKILHLTGVPGVRKTKLTAHLGWWWKATSLVEDSFHFDYDKCPSMTPELLLSKIYFQLFTTAPAEMNRESSRATLPRPSPACPRRRFLLQWAVLVSLRSSSPASDTSDGHESWMGRTLDRLRERPYLIVLDSLKSSEPEIKDDEVLREEVNEFLKMLQGDCSNQAVNLAGSILEKYSGDKNRFQGVENGYYLEMLLQVCGFNLLVMVCASFRIRSLNDNVFHNIAISRRSESSASLGEVIG
ncbi:hypothetical protein HOY80DRAFT_1005345 [Tuber brumale]|nr:hypothetical protein HOY80DRAFT_1005345 [Tuber brumale]